MQISRSRIFLLILFLVALILVTMGEARAQDGGTLRREIDLVMNKSYELFVGNAGIYMDNSQHIGTLVITAEENPSRPLGWHVFTQRPLDIQVYNKDGKPFEIVWGLVRVYFNLDKFQYDKWVDPDSNMSIWYFDQLNGGWHKCVTHWQSVAGLPKGRLWCVVHHYTRYGLAFTQPTMEMKLIKQGIITPTPTP